MKKFVSISIVSILMLAFGLSDAAEQPTIQYFGHSCFLITTSAGVKIVIDPPSKMAYPLPDVEADIVLATHEHFDHNNIAAIKGTPRVLRGLKEDGSWAEVDETIKGVHIVSVPVYHDPTQGSQRGKNTAFVLEFDGIRLAHLGDLGHIPEGDAAARLTGLDFILIPVGGHFTIGPDEAAKTITLLKPKVAIPMHFQTVRTRDLPIQPLDVFIKTVKKPKVLKTSDAKLVAPKSAEIWALKAP